MDDTTKQIQEFKDEFRIHTEQDSERFQHIEEKIDNQPTKQEFESFVKKMDDHMKEVKPFLQGAAGFGIIWKVFMGIGGSLVMWMSIKGIFGIK